MGRLDLVFVHLKRGGPVLGEMVRKGNGEIGLHVIYGPRQKLGQMIPVSTDLLKPYKVSSAQLKGAFPQGQMPAELVEKGSAYLITDKPTMYPDFSGISGASDQAPMTDVGGSVASQGGRDIAPDPTVAPAKAQDPNMALAQDFLKQGSESPSTPTGNDDGGYPMTFGIRRKYGNKGV